MTADEGRFRDGPCTITEADEDDEDRTAGLQSAYPPKGYDLVPGTCPVLGSLPGPVACNCTGACRPRLVKRDESSVAPVDVPVAARAGEALRAAVRRHQAVERERDDLRAKVDRVEALADGHQQPGAWLKTSDDEDAPLTWVTHIRAALDGYRVEWSSQEGGYIRAALADPAPVRRAYLADDDNEHVRDEAGR